MHQSRLLLLLAAALFLLLLADHAVRGAGAIGREREERGERPSDWWEAQRAFPGDAVDQAAYAAAVERAQFDRAQAALTTSDAGLSWQQLGPYNIGGRVTALAVAPGGTTIYLGAANGGVFKSTNGGVNWLPVLDHTAYEVFSVGALALDPGDPNVVYVGAGEANSSVDSYDGQGLFRSTDAGTTWKRLGLEQTARIARVAVDPADPARIFVAAMGTQFSTGPDRGLYRSEDGGTSWSKVLFVSDSTGACDVVFNPIHPETVFCATWERVRRYTYRRTYGPECGIWRSTDHGTSWTRLTNGLPAPSDNVGRIALGMCATKPWILYAQIIAGASGGYNGLGMYRTLDGGATWTRRDTPGFMPQFVNDFGGFGWYFGDVAVDPNDPDIVYAQGQILAQSVDGGVTYADLTDSGNSVHVDFHGMWIDPADSGHLYVGNDGGFFSSTNGGATWFKSVDLPISQFYAGCVDPSNVNRVGGGTQDNGCMLTAGGAGAWFDIQVFGADGFYVLIDPTNSNITFSEYQYGSERQGPFRSTNGGSGGSYPTGITRTDRANWCAPFAMDPSNHNVLLFGTHRVYKSTDNGVSYSPVSADLTTYPNPASSLVYHTITTLDISPVSPRVYYAGTDDGQVWRSPDAGGSWGLISGGLPLFYVTRVVADPVDSTVVYVCLSGFGQDEHTPRIYRSANGGASWASVSGDLPNAPANDLVADPDDPNTLFAGTDVGVYMTRNLGATWYPLGQGMPMQAVLDLTLHEPTRTLVAATHGRSQWKINLAALPVAVGQPATPARIALSVPAPNPSRGVARFALDLPRAATAGVAVFDATGRRVRTLLSGQVEAGRTALAWDGLDEGGRRARAGVYFIRATAAGATETRRLVRIE